MKVKKYIRDYFEFSRFERNAVLIIISLILTLSLINILLPYTIKKKTVDFTGFDEEVRKLKTYVADSIKQSSKELDQVVERSLFVFDPNEVSKEELQKLGFSDELAERFIRYRSHGGKFRLKEDVLKIYGLPYELYEQIEPYISIKINKPDNDNLKSQNDSSLVQKVLHIDLNKTNEKELQELPGVGPAFSRWILKYRDRLGGFVDKRQLLEVYRFDSNKYNEVKEMVCVSPVKLRKIPINTASYTELIKHPYINKELAIKIINCKSVIGSYKTLNDLVMQKIIINQDSFTRIAPYLSLWRRE